MKTILSGGSGKKSTSFNVSTPKVEYITKGACKLLGDCKPIDLCKELEKIQQKDTTVLEANNRKLESQVANLKVEITKKDEELR